MKFTRWIGTLGLFTSLAGYALAQAQVQSVTTTSNENSVTVNVGGTHLGAPKVIRAKKNTVYMLEWNAHLRTNAGRKTVNTAGVKYVWAGWFTNRPPKVRVQVVLTEPTAKILTTKTDTGYRITIGNAPTTTDAYKDAYEKQKFEKLPPITTANPKPSFLEPTAPMDTTPTQPVVDAKKKDILETYLGDRTDTTPKPTTLAPKFVPITEAKAKPTANDIVVSLDCVNTDVVQVLKLLALQSGVNIVTSPDVGGRINVKMNRVNLPEALNFVTTIANVRYAKIGDTYLVTSSARFSDALRQINLKMEESGETRVITLRSGEGKQIKAAALKALPQLASNGFYDIIVPTESIKTKTTVGSGATSGTGSASAGVAGGGNAQGSATGGANGGQGSAQGSGTASATVGASGESTSQGNSVELSGENEANKGGKDAYVVIVASPERIRDIVGFVENLDKRIAEANSINTSTISTRVVPIYSPNAQVILDSLMNMVSRDPKAAAYKLSLTSGTVDVGDSAGKLLILTGPAEALDSLELLARTTDTGIAKALGVPVPESEMEARKIYEVVEINWIEPLEAANEIQTRVGGISAKLMPGSVDPNVNGSRNIATESKTETSNASAQGTGSSTSGGTSQGGSTTGASTQAQNTGQETTAGANESNLKRPLGSEPMKLLLYGTAGQIAAARQLLTAIDIEPKQIAFELRAVELSKDDARKIGLDWSVITGGFLKTFSLTNNIVEGASGNVGGNNTYKSTQVTLDAMLDDYLNRNKVLARPNTLAMDGRTANLFIGDTIRYVEQIQATQSGVTVTTGRIDVGTTFKITARVGGDNQIRVNLDTNLTILKNFTPIPNGGQLPQTAERRITNSFVMNSGEILALGGLIQDSDRVTQNGFPWLKDLPIVGALFRSESKQRVRSEVVFFITARVVDSKDRKNAANPVTNDAKEPIDLWQIQGGKRP